MVDQWAGSKREWLMTFAWTWAGFNLSDHPDLLAVLQGFNTGTLASVDTTPPSVPTTVSQSGTSGTTSVSLAWNASTDNVGVAGYNVYNGDTLVGSTASTSYTVGSLACGSELHLRRGGEGRRRQPLRPGDGRYLHGCLSFGSGELDGAVDLGDAGRQRAAEREHRNVDELPGKLRVPVAPLRSLGRELRGDGGRERPGVHARQR